MCLSLFGVNFIPVLFFQFFKRRQKPLLSYPPHTFINQNVKINIFQYFCTVPFKIEIIFLIFLIFRITVVDTHSETSLYISITLQGGIRLLDLLLSSITELPRKMYDFMLFHYLEDFLIIYRYFSVFDQNLAGSEIHFS